MLLFLENRWSLKVTSLCAEFEGMSILNNQETNYKQTKNFIRPPVVVVLQVVVVAVVGVAVVVAALGLSA